MFRQHSFLSTYRDKNNEKRDVLYKRSFMQRRDLSKSEGHRAWQNCWHKIPVRFIEGMLYKIAISIRILTIINLHERFADKYGLARGMLKRAER